VNRSANRGQVIQTRFLKHRGISVAIHHCELPRSAPTDPFAKAIQTATAIGIIHGDTDAQGHLTGTVRPHDSINRAEMVTILTRLSTIKP